MTNSDFSKSNCVIRCLFSHWKIVFWVLIWKICLNVPKEWKIFLKYVYFLFQFDEKWTLIILKTNIHSKHWLSLPLNHYYHYNQNSLANKVGYKWLFKHICIARKCLLMSPGVVKNVSILKGEVYLTSYTLKS